MEAVTAHDFPATQLAATGVGATDELDRERWRAAATGRRASPSSRRRPSADAVRSRRLATLSGGRSVRYMPPATLAQWYRTIAPGGRLQTDQDGSSGSQTRTKILKALSDAGVPILSAPTRPSCSASRGFRFIARCRRWPMRGMTPYRSSREERATSRNTSGSSTNSDGRGGKRAHLISSIESAGVGRQLQRRAGSW